MSTNSIDNIRKLLDVIDLKRRDLTRYNTELRKAKLELGNLIEVNDRYRSDIHNTNQVLFQRNNIEIIDANNRYLDMLQKYNKTKQTVDHLETVIATYNINNVISDIKTCFQNNF